MLSDPHSRYIPPKSAAGFRGIFNIMLSDPPSKYIEHTDVGLI